jgi:hypothetical protein
LIATPVNHCAAPVRTPQMRFLPIAQSLFTKEEDIFFARPALGIRFFRSGLFLAGALLLTQSGPEAVSGEKDYPPAHSSMPAPERAPNPPTAGVGVVEIPRPDGGKDKIYFSISDPEEDRSRNREEKEKADRAWDLLRNVIIDKRSK